MQRKLLRIAGIYGMLFASFGAFLAGCVDEPIIEPVETMYTPTRFVNVCIDLPAVDIWIDDQKFANIPYKGVVDYTDIHSGTRFFRVTAVGADSSEALLFGDISFRSKWQSTLVVYGRSVRLSAGDAGRLGILITQERLVYSDETAKLPADSGKIKLINCVVAPFDVKFAQGRGLTLFDTVMVAGDPVVSARISGVQSPPDSVIDAPNLSGYVKYPVGQYHFGLVGTNHFLPLAGTALPGPWVENIERRYYTYIATGLDKRDVLRLVDR